ncbi:hydroxymethylglutaryl-CoA lyase [Capnocytophaga canimorsus]|uniref:hydroxymethylglutaryl-CoA lyase n=1 Tax=Capnocytophaga canimorsus TaxID=28188 RepID=UPI000D6DFBF8|nr:hydroxymethylglutaryl-CoA lyase [Capnocytophaga canimorsus]AWL77965.1 hydroxymethylglutaryl-CoA lyase [Capnocytophaga canimorsus]AYW36594.1 hydroxymethylglutaryl-CoA lyase [Capnocytophaga canimorsus]
MPTKRPLKIIECPRDAMQGIKAFIPTSKKIDYIQSLLNVGFDTIDFGSFVSAKAIPQMADTAKVLDGLDLTNTHSNLLAIVANEKGGDAALAFEQIRYLGYPFSISENFQMRNTRKTINESLQVLDYLKNHSEKLGKELVVYLSMGFGNPYGDPWSETIVAQWVEKLYEKGIHIISLSDTVGAANAETISKLFSHLTQEYPSVEFGAHFHTQSHNWFEKVDSAFRAGCLRFDGAILGFGGCPMAKDELVGNMPTEKLISYFQQQQITTGLNLLAFESSYNEALKIFL